MDKILEVKGLKKYFGKQGIGSKDNRVRAVDGIDFSVYRGETIAIVGESGCGKSTTGRCILRLIEPDDGTIFFEGSNLLALNKKEMRKIRKDMQIIFQDPSESMNPRATIKEIIEEPLIVHRFSKNKRNKIIDEIIEKVGLSKKQLNLYPHQFSGGQKQRIGIARALVLTPKLIIADEPVSALDVSVQSQILNLLKDLQEELYLTYIFISHDLSVVEYFSDRIIVMYLGEIVEEGRKEDLFKQPLHPYTKSLLSAIPKPDPLAKKEKVLLKGDMPSSINPPQGCRFHTRCPARMDICEEKAPSYKVMETGQRVACHLY